MVQILTLGSQLFRSLFSLILRYNASLLKGSPLLLIQFDLAMFRRLWYSTILEVESSVLGDLVRQMVSLRWRVRGMHRLQQPGSCEVDLGAGRGEVLPRGHCSLSKGEWRRLACRQHGNQIVVSRHGQMCCRTHNVQIPSLLCLLV